MKKNQTKEPVMYVGSTPTGNVSSTLTNEVNMGSSFNDFACVQDKGEKFEKMYVSDSKLFFF